MSFQILTLRREDMTREKHYPIKITIKTQLIELLMQYLLFSHGS